MRSFLRSNFYLFGGLLLLATLFIIWFILYFIWNNVIYAILSTVVLIALGIFIGNFCHLDSDEYFKNHIKPE